MMSVKKASGFSLVEVLLASGVMLIGTALVVSLTVNMARFSREEQAQNEIERETTLFLDYLERDMKRAAGVLPEYPGTSLEAQCVALKIPEFDTDGLHSVGVHDYAVYEFFPGTGQAIRTLYDGELGQDEITRIGIPVGECYFQVFADGIPLECVEEGQNIGTLQVSIMRYGCQERGLDYYRTFVVATTLRNPAE